MGPVWPFGIEQPETAGSGCRSVRSVILMAPDEKESDLYAKVRDWAESDDGLRCEKAWTNKGLQGARPDVTGIRHAGGHLRGDFELITIEVKKSSGQFLTSAGQAAAYGVYADRSYLCCPQGDKPFDEDNIDIASHLGIGLIEIGTHQEIERVLAAPLRQPIPWKRQELLESLGFSVCQICGIPYPRSGDPEDRKSWKGLKRGSTSAMSDAVKGKTGYVWWLWDWSKDSDRLAADGLSYDRRYLCRDCVAGLFWDLGPPEDDEV